MTKTQTERLLPVSAGRSTAMRNYKKDLILVVCRYYRYGFRAVFFYNAEAIIKRFIDEFTDHDETGDLGCNAEDRADVWLAAAQKADEHGYAEGEIAYDDPNAFRKS